MQDFRRYRFLAGITGKIVYFTYRSNRQLILRALNLYESKLAGGLRVIRIFENGPENSEFEFDNGRLCVGSLWRIVNNGHVVLSVRDHNQTFGLPEPVDVYSEASQLLLGKNILNVEFREESGDLFISL